MITLLFFGYVFFFLVSYMKKIFEKNQSPFFCVIVNANV